MGYFPLRTPCCLEYAKDWEQCRQNVQEPIRFCGGLTSLPIRLEGGVSVYFQHYKWQNQRGLRRYGSTKVSLTCNTNCIVTERLWNLRHLFEGKKTNIMMRRWNHNVILFRGISRFLSAVCRRWFPGQSGDRTCLVLYKRLVMCFARLFQLLPSACTSDIPLTLS